MPVELDYTDTSAEVDQIVTALRALPVDKVVEVRDFVWSLQAQYVRSPAVDVNDDRSEQELPDLTDNLSSHHTASNDAPAGHSRGPSLSPPPEFLESVATFERLLPQLLEQYRGQAVAISQDRVIASGPDKMSVWEQVISEYGQIPFYVEWVEPDAPRKVRMPSVRVVR